MNNKILYGLLVFLALGYLLQLFLPWYSLAFAGIAAGYFSGGKPAQGLIFYFLVIAPASKQRKKTQQILDALRKGDRVLTTGGIYGTVLGVDDGKAVLRIAEGQKEDVKVEFAKSAIVQVLAEGSH